MRKLYFLKIFLLINIIILFSYVNVKKKSINIPFVGPFTLPSCFVRSKPPQRKKRMGGIHLGVEIGGREVRLGTCMR